jgi:hypothetical protein
MVAKEKKSDEREKTREEEEEVVSKSQGDPPKVNEHETPNGGGSIRPIHPIVFLLASVNFFFCSRGSNSSALLNFPLNNLHLAALVPFALSHSLATGTSWRASFCR